MPRYVDADIFRERINHYPPEIRNVAKKELRYTPTADVVERKRGKWEVCDILDYAQRPTGRKVGKCPFCKYLTDEFRLRVDYYRKLTHFCPNCGSELKGDDYSNVLQ